MIGRALALTAVFVSAPIAAEAAVRIALPGGPPGPCRALEGSAPAAEKAYFRLLAQRLKTEVQKCPVADRAAGAQALASGAADLAILDGASYAPVRAATRAILTTRADGALSRVPVVLAVRGKDARALAALRGGSLVYGGRMTASLATPKQALADHLGPGFFASETVAADPEAAIARLRAGGSDAMVLHAGAWQRMCRGDTPKDLPCADLKVAWQGRQRAALAIVARRDMPDEMRFRLIGIHVAMHLEAPDAFAWARSWAPGAVEFEPTEAEALALRAGGAPG